MIKIIVGKVVVVEFEVVGCIVHFGCSKLEVVLGIVHFVPFEVHKHILNVTEI